MAGPGANLPYQLYIDAAYTTVWGDGTGGTSTVNGTSLVPVLGGSFSFTVWSSTPALAPIPAGTFSDNIIVTVSY
jgi:spore coat protein U-like protein